jgi:lipoate-protein ligase A
MNMALDEALLESVASGLSAPVLRLYRWSPPTVTLGYGQRGADVVNLPACRRFGYQVVRRMTGGRAVLHDREVTYAVIAPERNELFPGEILSNYRVIAGALQDLMATYGIDATLAPGQSRGGRQDGAQHSACFTAASSYELVYQGCKLTGSAQKRQGGAFLQHGSIPLEIDVERLFAALDSAGRISAERGGALLARSVGWLRRWVSQPLTIDEVEDRLIDVFSARFGIHFTADDATAVERKRAAELVTFKYADPAWTLSGITGPGQEGEVLSAF